jgi:hypothetical protein
MVSNREHRSNYPISILRCVRPSGGFIRAVDVAWCDGRVPLGAAGFDCGCFDRVGGLFFGAGVRRVILPCIAVYYIIPLSQYTLESII